MKKLFKKKNSLFFWRRPVKAVVLCVLLMFGVFPVMAQQSNVFKKTVTMHQKDVTLKEVLDKVQKQTGVIFIYSSEKLNVNQKRDVNAEKQNLRTFLSTLLAGSGLTFKLQDDYIVIETRPVYQFSNPGDIVISGIVADQNNQVLMGATVVIKETNVGVVTDANGFYSIKATTNGPLTLRYSYLGMLTKEVEYTGNNTINVQLEDDVEQLEDVVVTGYQDIARTRVAGAATTLSFEEVDITPISSIEQMLQGKVAGLTVINQSGEVGVRQKTRVRGTSTFLGSQEPIWVVDGIIQEDPLPFETQTFDNNGGVSKDNIDYIRNYVGNAISWLNPNDIEDVTVLKDASATAIYGVRAANGVIVIRTKKGKEGPLSVVYSYGLNVADQVTYDKLELMNSRERVAVSREIFDRGLVSSQTSSDIGYAGALNQYLFDEISYDEFNSRVEAMERVNNDWFNILFQNPYSQSHFISLSGGSSKARLYSSIGYSEKVGTAIGNESNSYNASLGFNSQVNDKFSVSLRLSGSKSKTSGFFLVSPYEYASETNRAIPVYDENGDLYFYQDGSNGYQYNYLNERDQSGNSNTVQALNSNLNINYNFLPNMKFNILGSYNLSSTMGYSYATELTNFITNIRGYEFGTVNASENLYKGSRLPVGGFYNLDDNQSTSWNMRANLSYSKVLGGSHFLSAMLGVEAQSLKYDGYKSTTYGYLHNRGRTFAQVPPTITLYGFQLPNPIYDGSVGTEQFQYAITDRKTNTSGYYLTLNYAYDNRYVLNFSVRGDASNRFGQFPNEKFNPVWAGGLRWNAGSEEFIQNINWLSNLSVRGSYGYQRNMASNFSPSLIVQIPRTTASNQVYDVNTGDYLLQIKNLPYPDLRWEQTTSYNLGVDLSLFDNKVSATVDLYAKKGKDIITTLSVPASYGIENMPVNGGSLSNKGLEFTVGLSPIRTNNFNWSLNFNTSKNLNKVEAVGVQNYSWLTAIQGNLLKEGYPMSALWAFKFDGVDPETGRPIIDLSVEEGASPDEDPTAYMEYVGKMNPDFTSGFSNSFRYKQFSLSASFYLQLGGKKFLKSAYPSAILPNEYKNLSSELNGRWTPDNTTAQLPGLPDEEVSLNPILLPGETNTYVQLYDMYNYSTDRVVDASSLRLNSLNASYNFSDTFCQKLKFKSLNIGLTASNVFSIVSKDFNGRDPEVATGNQPRTRSYSFNMNISF